MWQCGDMLIQAEALMWQGLAHHGLGDEEGAHRCLCEGLEIALKTQTSPTILSLLLGGSVLLLGDGKQADGIELLTIVVRHPATDQSDRAYALEVLSEQDIVLPNETDYQEDRPLLEVANGLLLKLRANVPAMGVDELKPGEDGRLQNGQSCPNEACELYGNVEAAQVIRFGKTKSGTQRYRCLSCQQTFTETQGTVFYRRQVPHETILEALALLAKGARIGNIARAKGVKGETVLGWLRAAAEQAEAAEEALRRDYQLSQSQIDQMWAYLGHEGVQETTSSEQGRESR